ncbi:aspartate--tRNA ligase [Candidatus Campbellbacteria bacterium]|nr:MAG: aspartate--tRNA ligase [Candidatus Campbellbacteria bacterium]
MKNRIYIQDLEKHIDSSITIAGWVSVRRDHGKLIFIDVRDETGKVQVVVTPKNAEALAVANTLRSEWVITLTGLIKKRPDNLVNEGEQNGALECVAESITVLAEATTPPFDLTQDTMGLNEETRLAYRYVDLRSARMQKNIRIRSEFVQKCREYLFKQGFVEIETPLLTQSTPEGSRDFLVPSRHAPGNFYALPQSPQQYKQLLMTSGFEKYFQLARCVRDEDLRADRGYEHTQLDFEMSFVTRDEVMDTIEGMITFVMESLGKTIKQKPFPRITYAEAMKTYGADKFDMRTPEEKEKGILAYAWVTDFPFFEKTDDGKWTFTHNPFSMPREDHLESHMKGENIENIVTQQYDLVCNGFETGGGSIRAHRPEILEATYKIMGYTPEQIKDSVGHMLEAFSHGVPPHGGIGLGIERGVMIATGESYLREVQAFPMTGKGKTAVMHAPGPIDPIVLRDLGLSVLKKKE